MLSAAQSLDEKEFERKDKNHKILTDKNGSKWKMQLSLSVLYITYLCFSFSNIYFLTKVAKSPQFDLSNGELKLLILDAVDGIHEVMFSAFFTLLFVCALRRIELLIDTLPDLEKNTEQFRIHKLVWGLIFANKVTHAAIAVSALIINKNLTPDDQTDVNITITSLT